MRLDSLLFYRNRCLKDGTRLHLGDLGIGDA